MLPLKLSIVPAVQPQAQAVEVDTALFIGPPDSRTTDI